MFFYKKTLFLIVVLICTAGYSSEDCSEKTKFYTYLKEAADSRSTKEDVTYDRLSYPPLSKMLFDAYLHQNQGERKEIDEILQKGHRDTPYLLNRAFRYGAKKLHKPMSLFKRARVITAIWKISQDFSHEVNKPSRFWPIVFWSGISFGSFVGGCYVQNQFEPWDGFSRFVTSLFSRGG